MKRAGELLFERMAENDFCFQDDKGKTGYEKESMFLNVETSIKPLIQLRSVFDECDDSYEPDLSFAKQE